MSTLPPHTEPAASLTDPRRQLLESTLGSQYEIIRQLGQGGAGVVYLAKERLLERLVAIKLLRSELISAESRERFVREARTAAKLMHAHIVPLYSFGQAGDTLYYIMGYVEGESLEAMLQRIVRLDPGEARRILVEVADALDYAHRNGVVHRDVKPDNIMIERDSRRAILTDFGIAKVQATHSTLTATGMIVGTPLYMSPEQAAGETQIDGRSDLYSLGVVGYRMVSGRLPIEGGNAQEVMRRHVMTEPEPLSVVSPHTPADLTWAVTRCLDKEPARRWPTSGAFRQALEAGEEFASELPEALEHLSGSGVMLVVAATVAVVGGLLAWTATGHRAWVVSGTVIAAVALGLLYPLHRAAQRFRLAPSRIWRLLGAPPERWAGWWPSPLRRPGDIWPRLPEPLRRFRAARTIATIALGAFVVPATLAMFAMGEKSGALAVFGASVLVALFAVFTLRSTAVRALRVGAGQDRMTRKFLNEPTWGSPFWRRPDVLPVLIPSDRPTEVTIDSSSEEAYCAITPTQPELPQGMFDHIDPRSPTPLYAQIASRLRVAIASGELAPGDGLPSVRQLSGRLRINPATVVQAYRELEIEGLVSTRQGAGTFVQDVAPDRKRRDRQEEARRLVRGLLSEAASMGISAADLRAAMDQEFKPVSAR